MNVNLAKMFSLYTDPIAILMSLRISKEFVGTFPLNIYVHRPCLLKRAQEPSMTF